MPKLNARSGQIKMEAVVGRNIRALRQARNLTVEGLASACGITKGQMSKIETGSVSAPLSTIDRIAQTLEATRYHITKSAEILGISRKTLLEKRKKYGMH